MFKKERVHDQCSLNAMNSIERSLAITKPRKVLDFVFEECSSEWSPKQKESMRQLRLDRSVCELEKIPWVFKYKFLCNDPLCRGHEISIEDWEIFQLYRKMKNKYGDDVVALDKVKDKYMRVFCSQDNDLHFFMGKHSTHNVWMIVGVFAPPHKERQLMLNY